MSNIFKHIALFCAVLTPVAMSVVSCSEGEHDYYYTVTNKTDKKVCLAYKIVKSTETLYDTLQPGETDTLCRRGNVSGDDIWDIETSSEIYQLSSLDVSLNDSLYAENALLRTLWDNVKESNDNGIYNLNVTTDLFTLRNYQYLFFVDNNSSYDFHFTSLNIPLTILAGSSFYYPFPYTGRSKYVTDLYDTTSTTTRVTHFTLSNIYWTSGSDTLYARNFNANLRSQWTFKPSCDAATYGTADSVGVYRLIITDKTLE